MEIKNIEKAKVLIDNFIRLREIAERIETGDLVAATRYNIDDDETGGLDYIDKIRLHIPAPLRAAFIQDVKKMMEIEARKIAEL